MDETDGPPKAPEILVEAVPYPAEDVVAPAVVERLGTPEQITALTIKLAEMKAEGNLRGPRMKAYRQILMERARLSRRRDRMTRDKLKLRLVKAKSAERVARQTVEEAAKAVQGTAEVLKSAIGQFGNISVAELAPFLVEELKSGDRDRQREAARMLKDITIAVFDLHKTASKTVEKAEKKKVTAHWPSEGQKS